ncbi:hypothetical protein [Nonomuraea dietziae]|uniref:hypothetical protein n=1 Tax=Nonomuraea dietziae TaxID=65515 RepID=UPI0031DDC85C
MRLTSDGLTTSVGKAAASSLWISAVAMPRRWASAAKSPPASAALTSGSEP